MTRTIQALRLSQSRQLSQNRRVSRSLALALGLFLTWLFAAPTSANPSSPESSNASPPAAITSSEGFREKARELAREIRAKTSVPGLSVTVARGEDLVFSEGFGWAHLETKVPATPKTIYRIGSLSKLLTVAAVARLVQENKLDLEAPVRNYVPSFPEKRFVFTTKQLCSHTAGIRHYGPNDGLDIPKRYETVTDGLAIFKDDPLLFEPGTNYAYTSYGYNLVSAVVEGASGEDFLSYLDDRVLTPLGMESTTADQNPRIIEGRAGFYGIMRDGSVVNAPYVDNSYKWAGGGLLSSSEDLARFAIAHLTPGFFEEKTLSLIFSPQPATENRGFSVGLGWRISRDGEGPTYYHHGGAIAGGRAFILAVPSSEEVVVMLANAFARFGLEEAQGFLEIFEDASTEK